MRGFHNSSFDPPTLAVLEVAFDEAWLTLKSIGQLAANQVPTKSGRGEMRTSRGVSVTPEITEVLAVGPLSRCPLYSQSGHC
jgi:hypothetical protein